MLNNRMGVIVASRIVHSRHLAEAISDLGLLEAYYSPILFDANSRIAKSSQGQRDLAWISSRLTRGAPIQRRTMWASDLTTQVLLRIPQLPVEVARAVSVQLADRTLPRRFAQRTIIHCHLPVGAARIAEWKKSGHFVIGDERAMHVLDAVERIPEPHTKFSRRMLQRRIDATLAAYEQADRIVVTSSLVADGFAARGADSSKIRVIPLGVSLGAWSVDRKQSNRGRRVRILFVGRLGTPKGLDVLIAAVQGLERDIEVTLVGCRDMTFNDPQGGFPSSFRLRGSLSAGELREEYARSDLLVLPSRIDSFGLVAAEALAAGVPVIVSDQCGIAEHLKGECGWIVQSGSSASLRDAIEQALDLTPNQWRIIREKARELAFELSWDTYHQKIKQLYAEVLADLPDSSDATSLPVTKPSFDA